MGLNLDWFKSCGLRCRWRPCACSANFQKIAIDKWPFYYLYLTIFLPTVCLSFTKLRFRWSFWKYLRSLNPNWYKSYDTKRINERNANEFFCTKLQTNGNWNICSLCHNLWTNQNLDPVITSKWPSELQFCERWIYSLEKKIARNGRKIAIYQCYSFLLRLYMRKLIKN